MSQIYRNTHDLAKAQAMSDKAKALEPDNLEVRYNEVGILEAEGKPRRDEGHEGHPGEH